MWIVIGGGLAFLVVGLFCTGLLADFRGWRNRWIETGAPDDHLRSARRLGILGFGWVGALGSLYALVGFVIIGLAHY